MAWYMWFILFTAGCLAGNMILRIVYGKKYYFYQTWVDKGYKMGYRDGASNVKMYYSVKSKLPSTQWVKQNQGRTLNTREKILSSLNSEN